MMTSGVQNRPVINNLPKPPFVQIDVQRQQKRNQEKKNIIMRIANDKRLCGRGMCKVKPYVECKYCNEDYL